MADRNGKGQLHARPIFLTGKPGVGKTTLVCAAARAAAAAGCRVGGFYTEERRGADGKRAGFDVVAFAGDGGVRARGVLASLSSAAPVRGPGRVSAPAPASGSARTTAKMPTVGKYAVDVAGFEGATLLRYNFV